MTLTEARTYVLSRLGVTSGETDVVALVDAQLDLELQRIVLEHRLAVDVAELPLTADDQLVDLPPDVNTILKLNRGRTVLEPATWDAFASRAAGGDGAGDEPDIYLMSGSNRIRLYPTPGADDDEGLTCWYSVTAEPWGATEPTSLPRAFHDLPCERVVAFLALIEEDERLAAAADARADRLEGRLVRHLARRGGLGPSTIRVAGLP